MARTRSPRRAKRTSASGAPLTDSQTGSTASGAPLTRTRLPTTTDMRRRRVSNGNLARSIPPASPLDSFPTRRAKASSAASIGSPCGRHEPSTSWMRPDEQRTAAHAIIRKASITAGESHRTVPMGS